MYVSYLLKDLMVRDRIKVSGPTEWLKVGPETWTIHRLYRFQIFKETGPDPGGLQNFGNSFPKYS